MNLKLREIIIVIASLLIITGATLFYVLRKDDCSKAGNFTLIIALEDESVVFEDELSFSNNEKLYDVIERNFNLICANKNYEKDETCSYAFPIIDKDGVIYSKVILGIEVNGSMLETDFKTTFLEIQVYENNQFRSATKGFSSYCLTNGEIIRIKVTRIR